MIKKVKAKTEQIGFKCPVSLKAAVAAAAIKEYRNITAMMVKILREWEAKQ